MVVTNADGYRYVVAPMVDGYHWQGFKVNGNLNITKIPAGHGAALQSSATIRRTRPRITSRSGQGTPQVWEPNIYAAGTAVVRDPHRQIDHDPAEHSATSTR